MNKYKTMLGISMFFIVLSFIAIYVKNHTEDFSIIKNVSIIDFLELCLLSFLFYMSSIIEIGLVARFCKIKIKFWDKVHLIMITLLGNYFFPYSGIGLRAGFLKNVYGVRYTYFITTFMATFILKIVVYSVSGMIAFTFIAKNIKDINALKVILFTMIALLCLTPFIPLKISYNGKNKIITTAFGVYHAWLEVIKDRKLLVGLLFQNILEFAILSFVFMSAYDAFDLKVSYFESFLPAGFSVLSFIFKITPGALGIYEGLVIFSSSLININLVQSLMVATLIRIAGLIWIIPCGIVSFFILAGKLRISRA